MSYSIKKRFLKLSFLITISLLLSVSISSCTSIQYGVDAQKKSSFSEFDDLGIAKEEFIKQYGIPTSKGLYKEGIVKVERLYYTEKLRGFLVTTVFTFEDAILKEMKKVEIKNDIQGQLDDIERQTR